MTRKSQQLLILGVLGVVMVAVYAKPFGRRQPKAALPVPAAPPGAEILDTVEWPDRSTQRRSQRDELVQLAWARDPFVRGASTDGASALSLAGILWDTQAPLAMISGETVGIGAEIGGFRVMKIEPDRVLLSDGQQTVTLTTAP